MLPKDDNKKGGWLSRGLSIDNALRQEKTQDLAPVIDQELKRKTIKVYYMWLGYTGIITILILVFPESWMSLPSINWIVKNIADKMPYIVYLSGISDSPQVVKFCYSIAWLSGTIHALFTIITTIMNYRAGYFSGKQFYKIKYWCWAVPVFIWTLYFTCMACKVSPDRHELFAISSRLVMAFLGQVLAYASALVITFYIILIFHTIRSRKVSSSRKEGTNA